MGLVMEQMRNMVSGRIGLPASRSIMPCALNHATWPRRATSVTAPAMRLSSMLRWTAAAIRSSRSDDRPTVSGFTTGRSCATATVPKTSVQMKTEMHVLLFISFGSPSLPARLRMQAPDYKAGSGRSDYPTPLISHFWLEKSIFLFTLCCLLRARLGGDPMSAGPTTGGQRHLGATMRRDAWWLELLPVIFLLGAFGIYATLRAFEGTYYEWGPYLSPFYSPLIDPHHRWWPFSPALLILVFPLGFRVTCYYYRKAYYRAFFLDPPACAVGERGKHRYRGETAFPFFLQNLHRYFLYVGIIFLVFLWRDAFRAFFFDGHLGLGVGTLVLLFNVTLLTIYALSCHSLRHLVGGKLDCFSCAAL